ncbi:MAG: DUF507 family protein [Nitrospinae bacterium]|nr:DUF507 family protein [Nitrospinota bacterium]
MRLKKEMIQYISQSITTSMIKKGYVHPIVDEKDIYTAITHVITEDLMVEDRLDEEVKEILERYRDDIDKRNVDYRNMFQMIKKKLIEERGLIL